MQRLNEHAKAQIERPKFLSKTNDRKSFYGLELRNEGLRRREVKCTFQVEMMQ